MGFLSGFFGQGGTLSRLFLRTFQLTDILDILVVTILIYELLIWIRKTRGWMLFKGIILVVVFWLLAAILELNMVLFIFDRAFSVGILAIIIIFQPELRRALEKLGTSNLFTNMVGYSANTVNERSTEALIEAIKTMAQAKTGALIAVEQKVALGEYEQTGIPIDAEISAQLLINIFEKNTPLHDGAVIIRRNRVLAATCYLPLSENSDISKELGTRHRAALGLSEVSDAKVFIVSEETGAVSMAYGNQLYRNMTEAAIRRELLGDEETNGTIRENLVQRIFNRVKKEG